MHKLTSLIVGLTLTPLVWAAPSEHTAPSVHNVLSHYADLAHATYGDSLITAKTLQKAVKTLVSQPTDANLMAARAAWKAARVPYQQTEAFRFGNPIVDEWEGKVNAWPLDEGLIDYVAPGYGEESEENPHYTANIIANPLLKVAGKTIDATNITPSLLRETLHELDEIETNVATGYHAIEFLLWGQDLNGTAPGAGTRPATDFDPAHCTGGHCERRIDYLVSATALLVNDLKWMHNQWRKRGQARKTLLQANSIEPILTGLGSLSYGELAGERIKLGVMLHDPEEEHDCFSDNTHWSHYYDAQGILNVYTGTYTRITGEKIAGPSISDLVAHQDPALDWNLRQHLITTMIKLQAVVDSAEKEHMAYDQLIAANNPTGNATVMAVVDALVDQTKIIEKAVETLQLKPIAFEGSDSLDSPEQVAP